MLDKCSFLTWCWFLRISLLDAIIKYMFRADQKFLNYSRSVVLEISYENSKY